MKKTLRIATGLALSACFVFAGCKSLPSVQEQFQTGCTIVNGDLTILSTSPLLSPAQQATIANTILPANEAICKADGQLNVTNLKAFHDSLLPAAIAIVAGVPAIPNQPAVLLGLQTFGPMVQAMIDQIITAAAPAPASSPQ
jgi:hypothetical protein